MPEENTLIISPVHRQRQPLGEPVSDQRLAQARAVSTRLFNEEMEAAHREKREPRPVPSAEEILAQSQPSEAPQSEPEAPSAEALQGEPAPEPSEETPQPKVRKSK